MPYLEQEPAELVAENAVNKSQAQMNAESFKTCFAFWNISMLRYIVYLFLMLALINSNWFNLFEWCTMFIERLYFLP